MQPYKQKKQALCFSLQQTPQSQNLFEQLLLLKLENTRLTQINQLLQTKQNGNSDVLARIEQIQSNLNDQIKLKEQKIQQLHSIIKDLHRENRQKFETIQKLKLTNRQLEKNYIKEASQLRALSSYSANKQLSEKNLSLFEEFQARIKQTLKDKQHQISMLLQKIERAQECLHTKEKQIIIYEKNNGELTVRINKLQKQIDGLYEEDAKENQLVDLYERRIEEVQKEILDREMNFKQALQNQKQQINQINKARNSLQQKLKESIEHLLKKQSKIRDLNEQIHYEHNSNKNKVKQIQKKLLNQFKVEKQQAIINTKTKLIEQNLYKEKQIREPLQQMIQQLKGKLKQAQYQYKQLIINHKEQLNHKQRQFQSLRGKYQQVEKQKQQISQQWKQLLKETARQRNIIQQMQESQEVAVSKIQSRRFKNMELHSKNANPDDSYFSSLSKKTNLTPKYHTLQQSNNQLESLISPSNYFLKKNTYSRQSQYLDVKGQAQLNKIQQQEHQASTNKQISIFPLTNQQQQNNKSIIQTNPIIQGSIPLRQMSKTEQCYRCRVQNRQFKNCQLANTVINQKCNSQSCNEFLQSKPSKQLQQFLYKKRSLIFKKGIEISFKRQKTTSTPTLSKKRKIDHDYAYQSFKNKLEKSRSVYFENRSNSCQCYYQQSKKKINRLMLDKSQSNLHSNNILSNTLSTSNSINRLQFTNPIKHQPYLKQCYYDVPNDKQLLEKLTQKKGWNQCAQKYSSCMLRKQNTGINNFLNKKIESSKISNPLHKIKNYDAGTLRLDFSNKQNQQYKV